jgi:hypothetical protein
MGRANQFDRDSAVRILRLVDAGKSRLAPAEREVLCRVAIASLMGERLSDAELLWARSVMARYRSADAAEAAAAVSGAEGSRAGPELAPHKRALGRALAALPWGRPPPRRWARLWRVAPNETLVPVAVIGVLVISVALTVWFQAPSSPRHGLALTQASSDAPPRRSPPTPRTSRSGSFRARVSPAAARSPCGSTPKSCGPASSPECASGGVPPCGS